MRVGQLGVQVQVEVVVEGKLLVSHLDVSITSLFDNGTSIDGLEHGIDGVKQVLDQHGLALFDS